MTFTNFIITTKITKHICNVFNLPTLLSREENKLFIDLLINVQ